MIEYSGCIDWLSFTMRQSDNGALFDIPYFVPGLDCKEATPHFGYRRAVQYECGLLIMYDGAAENMGAHYQYSGKTLNALRASGVTIQEILAFHDDNRHKCTRCDLAIDIRNDGLFELELSAAIAAGKRHGTAKNISEVRSLTDQGRTVYVGSRSSDIFCRIYNKAAEQRVEGCWTRCEVEVKGKAAQLCADRVQAGGEGCVKALAEAELEKRAGFEFPGWTAMLQGQAVPLVVSSEPTTRTKEWLLATCASSLAKYIVEHPEDGFYDVFKARVEAVINLRREGAVNA